MQDPLPAAAGIIVEAELRPLLDALATTPPGRRLTVGIAGPPGAGKSTVAEALAAALDRACGRTIAAVVPMDGYHLPNAVLDARGLRAVKGRPETFDAESFSALLPRVRDGESPLPLPTFTRDLDEPTPGGIVLGGNHRIALVEGNYLYLRSGSWPAAAAMLDRRVFLMAGREVCRGRLLARHIRFGKTPDQAARHVETVDLVNWDLVVGDLEPGSAVVHENG